jgi:hypothetical protein
MEPKSLPESRETPQENATEEKEDKALGREERKKRARLRRRGPYRKAHVNR